MKQRVLRYDEDPLAGVKNFENFALLCRNKEREDIVNGVEGWITEKDTNIFGVMC